jgi:hypothetical protein
MCRHDETARAKRCKVKAVRESFHPRGATIAFFGGSERQPRGAESQQMKNAFNFAAQNNRCGQS